MPGDFAYVEMKLDEAHDALLELNPDEHPATYRRRLHAFLAAARSVLQVMRYQFGYHDLKHGAQAALAHEEAQARKAFDCRLGSTRSRRSATLPSIALARPRWSTRRQGRPV